VAILEMGCSDPRGNKNKGAFDISLYSRIHTNKSLISLGCDPASLLVDQKSEEIALTNTTETA